ncbi:hypothetical protein M758_4G012000 [Ceratodon purpureus]|uniref:Secreted protein n=1 Tax=Ceratodon purpureus TaxID=3225 RepID=A0A8T0I5D0_CERPU|nr:hypothetical protein KC19_4G013200 [Ceratodon purpureus]KAG0617748.1 hypothetical protein M758_4G012000 [Ceratodon purpureus]
MLLWSCLAIGWTFILVDMSFPAALWRKGPGRTQLCSRLEVSSPRFHYCDCNCDCGNALLYHVVN